MEDRREFLIKVATGAVYAAPVIRTLTAPRALTAQNHREGGYGHGHGHADHSGPRAAADHEYGTLGEEARRLTQEA